MHTKKQSEKNIVLIGFMGVGKTSAGNVLADQLNCDFVDTDEEIEKEANMPTAKIFATFGEKAFREREKQLIIELCEQQNGTVISLGGGAFLQKEIREACLSTSTVVFLDISWKAWQERLPLIFDSRPVLHEKTSEEMNELFYKRKKIYEEYHHIKVKVDQLSIEATAKQIINGLKEDAYRLNS